MSMREVDMANKVLERVEAGTQKCPRCFNQEKVDALDYEVYCHPLYRCGWCHFIWAPVEEYRKFDPADYTDLSRDEILAWAREQETGMEEENDADAGGEGAQETENEGTEDSQEQEETPEEEGGEEPPARGRRRASRTSEEA